jgi:hypothetical protein
VARSGKGESGENKKPPGDFPVGFSLMFDVMLYLEGST